jgi:hypothetical protein
MSEDERPGNAQNEEERDEVEAHIGGNWQADEAKDEAESDDEVEAHIGGNWRPGHHRPGAV